MNYFALTGLINGLASSGLAVLIYYKGGKEKLHSVFALFCVSVAYWSFGYFFWHTAHTAGEALIWTRSLMQGSIFIAVFYLHFILIFTGLINKQKILLYLSYAQALFFLMVSFSPLYISHIREISIFEFWPKPGILYAPFLIIWVLIILYCIILLLWHYQRSEGSVKIQTKYIIIATLIGYSGGSMNYFLYYDILIIPYFNFTVALYVIIIAYTILRYRLFGVKIILNKTLIYITTFILTATILYVVFLLSRSFFYQYPYLSALFSIMIFSVIFNPLHRLSKKLSTQVFYNGYNPYDNVSEIISQLKKSVDVVELLNNISSTLKKILGVTKTDLIILLDDEGYRFESINKQQYEKSIIVKLISFFKLCKITLIKDEIARLSSRRNSNLMFKGEQIEIFKKTNSHLIAPFYHNDLLIGILLIGNRERSHSYNREDIELLENIIKGINELVINLKMRYILDSYTNNK